MDGKRNCLALRIAGEPDARRIRQAAGSWGALEVEVFPGRGETLLLIHPAEGVYIDRRAAELLRGMAAGEA